MTFKANIASDQRVIYTLINGNDDESGTSLETAKATIQGAVDAVNNLSPPPDGIDRAAIIVSGSGVFSENISFPNFTSVDASTTTNAVASGINYTLGSFSTYQFGLVANSGTATTMIDVANESGVALTVTEGNLTGDGTTFLAVSGSTDDSFFRCAQLRLQGDGSIGVNYTASNGEPEVFLFASITLEEDNTVAFVYDPSVSTARSILDAGGISNIGSPSTTTAIRVIDGHLSVYVNEIVATQAIDVQGGELSIISNCVSGDITVAVGATLVAEIAEFSGTLINNGTIQGRIGSQYFGSSFVTGPGPTVATNSAAVFSDTSGSNISNVDDILLYRVATTTTAELVAEVGGSSRLDFSPTAGVPGAFISFTQSSGITQMINTLGDIALAVTTPTSGIIVEAGSTSSITLDNPGDNTNSPVNFSTQGIDGATVDFYVSAVTPEGVITATQGAICWVVTGVDGTSAVFIKETGVGNTGWINLHSATSGISGPVTSTVNAIPTFDVITGNSVQDNPFLRYESDGATSSTLILQRAAAGTGEIELRNNADTIIGLMQISGANFAIDNVGTGNLSMASADGDVIITSLDQIVTITGNDGVSVSSSDTAQSPLRIQGQGEPIAYVFTDDASPEGVRNAEPGSISIVVDTVTPSNDGIYQLHSTVTANTPWEKIGEASGVTGPAISTIGAITTWDVTDGESIQDNPFLRYESDGATTSTLILQRAAAGSGEIELRNNADTIIGLMQISGANFQIDNVGTGDLSLGSGSGDALLTALNGGVTITAGGDTLRVRTTGAHTAIFEASGSGDVDINANAGSISLINNHGEITMDPTTMAFVTATNVNFNVDATAAGQVNIESAEVITLHTMDSGATVAIVGNGGDTFPIATFTTNGTGGGTFNLHSGTSSPQGRVSGSNTLFFETGIANSGTARIHYQDTDATTTNWNVLTSIASGATQSPGALMGFPTSDLAQGAPTTRLFYDESGINSDMEIASGTNGTSAIRLKDDSVNDRFVFVYNDASSQASISTVASTPLNIFASGNLDINATGTSDFSSAQSMTIQTIGATSDITIDAGDDVIINANDEVSMFGNGDFDISCGALFTTSFFTRYDFVCGQNGDLPILNLSNGNTQFNIFAYFQTPFGNVTGTPGDFLIENNQTFTSAYIHAGTVSNNTSWRPIASSPIVWGNSSIANGADTRYLTPYYGDATALVVPFQYRLPKDGIIQNMYVRHGTATGNGNNIVYTLRINGVNTALTVTVASNVQDGSNTVNRIRVNRGDLIDLQALKAVNIGNSPSEIVVSCEIY